MKNQIVHRAAANTHDRRAAGLTFQRDQSESFLHARMNKKVGRAIIASQLARLRAVFYPGNVFASRLHLAQVVSLRSIANHQQMKIIRSAPLENFEGTK